MDPITHGLVGALSAQSVSEKKTVRLASLAGAGSAMLADLDILIFSASDPLLNIEFHRQFSHSFLFIPAGALLSAGIFWWLFKKKLTFSQTYLYCLAGYATNGLLDACTSYGTALLWPFSDKQIAWNLISVVDPFLTIGLFVFIILGVYQKRKIFTILAASWLFLFLLAGALQYERSKNVIMDLAESRQHVITKFVIKPTIGNQLLWRSTYISSDSVFSDAVRAGWGDPKIYKGESGKRLDIEREYKEYKNTVLYDDLLRFKRLSNGFLINHPTEADIIGDARYSMLPTSMIPLWGIEADTLHPNQHVSFLYFRDSSKEIRETFINLLLGRENS